MKNMIPGLSLPYRTKCVDKNPPPPEKVYPGNCLRLPSPHREILFERCSRTLEGSTGAADVPLGKSFSG